MFMIVNVSNMFELYNLSTEASLMEGKAAIAAYAQAPRAQKVKKFGADVL